ncbi:recombinase family protein [Rhodococcus sp. P1Y]|uniref:recombinase family protein n=1 Tax=Rhodococcus sp. P1Y TaxID=1302308 RepID=UPI000EB048A3|nr:recombinase family protein [Rhodococcus sp. P1Y]AYJ48989.1 recombinase family protein [Rhodococcus sp. P1Y]
MTTPRMVTYARVSMDRSGVGKSVEQQVDALQAEALAHGWTLGPVVKDVGIGASRFSTKDRPGYAQLKTILESGDILAVWETSRATRRTDEWAALTELCRARGVRLFTGTRLLDLDDPDDEQQANQSHVAAVYETAKTRKRVKRDVDARAKLGKVHAQLGFGYRRVFDPATGDKTWELDPVAADAIREAVDGLLAGTTTIYRIVKRWNDSGLTTSTGKPWQTRTLRQMLLRESLAGIRVLRGQKLDGPAVWEPIITESQHRQLVARYGNQADPNPRRGLEVKHLLTGIATCYKCGQTVNWQNRPDKVPQYRCPTGHVSRQAEEVDKLAVRHLRRLIEQWRVDGFFAEAEPDAAHEHLEEAARLEKLLADVDAAYSRGDISIDRLAAQETALRPRIEAARERAASVATNPILYALAFDSAVTWESADVPQRRSFVRACLRIEIQPTGRGQRVFDPASVAFWDISRGASSILLLKE